MKLIELEISNIRGVKHLKLSQNGKNFVIYGPNGSGKSTVVDAVDFLLTGQIKRLTGEGTGQMSLKRYGPHIDHDPEEAIVRALVNIQGLDDPIELKRCIGQPTNLEYDKSIESYLKPILELAKRGHYILTRKEILKYITSTPGNRAQQIQDLLNLNEIESIRKRLVKISNKFKNEYDSVVKSLELSTNVLLETVNIEILDEQKILDFINLNRKILGGNPISILSNKDIKIDLSPPRIKGEHIFQDPKFVLKNVERLIDNFSIENQNKIRDIEYELNRLIEKMKKRSIDIRDLKRLELIKIGLELIGPTGDCPLCNTSWEEGTLRNYLTKKLSEIKEFNDYLTQSNNLTQELKHFVYRILESVQFIIENKSQILIKDILKIESWKIKLRNFLDLLNESSEKLIDINLMSYNLKDILFPDNIDKVLDQIRLEIDLNLIKLTPEQIAWDNLTKLVENLKIYFLTKENLDSKRLIYRRAEILKESFQIARDRVLKNLYDTIRKRFEEIYKKIHGLDEEQFTSKLESKGAGINLEVDFYGKGNHPPQALHSEGHQDSMGICLYLALAENVSYNLMNLIILDDVVMSIDSDHRRSICNILKTCFPQNQFLITTHDKTWMNQLKTEKVITSRNLVEFYNWSIETGPQHKNLEIDMWKKVYKYLGNRDIPNAAFTLRRGLEQFFSLVCDSLQAKVVYKISGRYELTDFLKPSIGKYNELLKKAKISAQSWQKNEIFIELQELSSVVSQIFDRTYAEQWAVNSTVHYNNWSDLSLNDFKPVVEAFEDLCQLFICGECGGIIFVLKDNHLQEVNVTCGCGNFNWNLKKKN